MIKKILPIFFLFVGCSNREYSEKWIKVKNSCEEIIKDDGVKTFNPRYISTNKNRYLIGDDDNIVVGDSICKYHHVINSDTFDGKWTKNSGYHIYEN